MIGILLAILASTLLNVGKGVQKWKVHVFAAKREMLSPKHRKDFSIWVVGLSLTTVASIFYSLALKFTDKPSTVSALNGVGLIGLVIFAWLVLKEEVGKREVFGAALIIIGTAVMGAFDKPLTDGQNASLYGFTVCALALAALFVPLCIYAWRAKKFHGLIFGTVAGSMIGHSMVLADVALALADDDFFGQLVEPYVYIALTIGTGALIVTQLAFWRAKAMVVVPTINSFIISMPLLVQYATFGTVLGIPQYAGIGIIIPGVVLVTMGRSS